MFLLGPALLVGLLACVTANRADSKADDTAPDGLDSADSGGGDSGGDSADTGPIDGDGDGYVAGDDCLDSDDAVHPGAREVCNDGLDNDCDGGPGPCAPEGGDLRYDAAARYLGSSGTCGELAGSSLTGAGDLDADGFGDLLVGAPAHCGANLGEGAVYVVRGGASPADGALSAADAVWTGLAESDNAGAAVAAGDFDGDGRPDLAIGAPGNDAEAADGGAVYLLLGAAGLDGGSLAGAAATFTGPVAGGLAGGKVDAAGDVDGDGREDLLVSGYAANTVWLVLGAATPSSDSLGAAEAYVGAADLAGWGLAGAGDIDGDGLADVLIGAQNNSDGGVASAGAAFLVLGSASPRGTALSSAADAQFTGDSDHDYAGVGVDGLGDFDGDGHDDMVVSAPYDVVGASVGSVYVVLGTAEPVSGTLASVGLRYTGAADDYTGGTVAGPGDIDGDGFAELLVGADHYGGPPDTGGAWVLRGGAGPTGGALADLAVLYTGAPADYAGASVAGAGDIDGDGRLDFLVGAIDNEAGGYHAGAAYLVRGVGL